jgi:hypothetical protein
MSNPLVVNSAPLALLCVGEQFLTQIEICEDDPRPHRVHVIRRFRCAIRAGRTPATDVLEDLMRLRP